MKMKRKTWIILGSVMLVLIGAAVFGYSEYTRGHADMAEAKAEVCITAPALLGEFTENEAKADAKYLNKVTCTRGVVKSIDKDHTGSVSVTLETGDPMASVSCELDTRHIDEAEKIHDGDTVNVTGICTGMLTDVVLVNCSAELAIN